MDFLHQQETQQKKIEKLETSADATINKAEEEFATNILKTGLNFLSVDKPVKQQLKEIGSDIISVGGLMLNNPILTTTALFNRQQGRLTKSAKDLAVATINYIVDRKGERQEYIDNIKQQINNNKKNTLYGFEVDENNNILNKKGLEGVRIKEDDNNLYFLDGNNKIIYQRAKKREYEINFKKDFTKTELEEMRKVVPRYSKMSDQQWQEYINKPHKRNAIIDGKLAQQLTPMISTISEETINDWQMAKPMGVLEYLETLTKITKMKPALNNIAIKIRTGERLTDEEIETLKEYKTREAETMYRGVSFAGKLLPSIETDLEVQARATIDSYYAHKLTKAGLKGWKPQNIGGRIGKYLATVGLNVIGTYITSKITDKTPIANIGAGNDRQKLLEKYRSNVLQLSDKGEMILNKNYSQEKENFFKYQTTIENLGEIISEEILDAPMEALGAWIDNKILGGAIEKLGGKYNILQKIYLGAKKINSIPNTFGTTFDSLATEHLEELAGMTFKYLMKANDPDSTLAKEIKEYGDDFLLSTANILIAGGLFKVGVGALTGDKSRQSNDSLSGLVLKRYLKENTNLKEEEINHKVDILAESTKDKLLDQLYQKEDVKSKEKYENKIKELETILTEERGEEEAKNQMAVLDSMAGSIARKMGVSRYDIIEGYKQEFSDSIEQWEKKRNKNDEILYNETIIKNKFIQDALKDVKVEDVKLDLTTEFNSLAGQSKNDMSKAIEKQLKNLIEKSFNTGTPPYKIQILGKKIFLVGNKEVSINLKKHIKDSNLSLKKQQLKNHNGALLSLEKIINNSTTNETTEPINNKRNKWKIEEYKKTLEGARYFKSFFKVGDNYFLVKLTTFLNKGQEDKNISDLYNVAVTPLELTNSREFAPISATTIESIDTQQQKSSNILNQEEETQLQQKLESIIKQLKNLFNKEQQEIQQEQSKVDKVKKDLENETRKYFDFTYFLDGERKDLNRFFVNVEMKSLKRKEDNQTKKEIQKKLQPLLLKYKNAEKQFISDKKKIEEKYTNLTAELRKEQDNIKYELERPEREAREREYERTKQEKQERLNKLKQGYLFKKNNKILLEKPATAGYERREEWISEELDFDYSQLARTLNNILKKNGWEEYHQSGKKRKYDSSIYLQNKDGEIIRISDHYIPETAEREYNREQRGGDWYKYEKVFERNYQFIPLLEKQTEQEVIDYLTDKEQEEDETTFNQNDINSQPITIENTFKDYKDIKDLIAQAKEYYRDNLQGTYIEREDIGKVYFTKTGIDKTINSSRGHPIIMQTIPYLKDIIKSGEILNNEDLKKETKDKELIGYIGLKNNINTERGEYNIIALLQKRNDGNYYYTNYLKIKEGADPLNPKRAGAINTQDDYNNENLKINNNNETIYNQTAPTEKKEIETLENQKEEIEKQLQEFEEENEEIEKRNKEIYKEELNNLNQQYRSKEEAIKKIEEKKEELKKETDEKIEDFKKEVKETKNETMKFKMELKYYDFKTELEDRLNKKLKELAEKKDKLVQEQDEILNNKYKILDRNKEILHKEWEEKNEEYENIKQQIIETKFGKKPKSNNYFYTYKEFAERFLKEGDTSIPLYEYDGYVDEDKGYYIYDDGEKIFINDFLPISKEDYYNKLVDKNPQYSFNKLNNREYNKAQKALQLYSHLMVDNHKLRKGEETERARIVQKAIDNQYIPNEKILYRGLQKSEYTNKIKQMKVGESFEEKAFSSTSQSKEVAERFTDDEGAMLIIKTPARKFGVGIYVEGVGNLFANDENEFLLNKGTFTITKKDGNNIYVDFKPKTDKNKLIITHELELKKMESILNNKNLLVAPSLAIQRAEKSGDNRYGEIKLIGSKELITGEKYKNTKVYKTDSYTPALFHSNYDIKKINGKEALVKYDDNGEVVTIEPYTPEKQLEILKQQKNSENATKDLGREITEEDIKTIELDKNKDIRQQLEEQGANLERYAEGKIMDLVSLKDFQGAIMPNTKEYDKVANKLEQLGLTVKRVDYNDVYGELDKEQYNKALEDIENERQVLFQRQLNNTLDLTDEFKHKPTFKEVKEYIETLIETARQFTTLNPDWLIDIKKEPSRNKQERITKKILNYGNFKNLNRTQQERYNNYILQLEKILNNATYTGEQPNNKQGQKPQVEKYHYFTSNIKVGNNYYKIILDAEQYKGENETKPQVVHLYNISEIKTSPDANDLSGHIIGQRGLLDNSITNNNQNVKGNIVFNRDYSEAIINLFRDKADQSTLLHENMHFFEKTIERYARKGYPVAQQMYNEIKKAVGETEQYMRVEKSEDLARWYEQYIRTGKYQNPILKNVYDYFREHLLRIYEKASDLNIDINNPELYKFFDKYIFAPTKYVKDSDWLYKLHTEVEDDKQQESKEEATEKILDDEIPLFETILKQSDDVEELAKAVQEYVEKLKEKGLTKEDALKDTEFIKLANEYLEKIKKNLEENPLTERQEVELYNNELQDIISNLAPNETKTINIRGKNIEIDNSIFDLIKNNNLSYNEFYKGLNNLDYGVIIQETPEQTTLTDNEGLKTILTKQGENYRITEIDNGRQKQEIKQSAITIEKTFKNYKDIKDLVAQAKEYYKNNLQGTYIEREDIGIIEFTREGIEKTINTSKGHPDLMQIIPQLKELVKSGEFVAEEKLNKIRKDKTKSFIAIYNNIKLDDKNKSILILLKRTDNGKYYYTSYLDLDNKNSYRELQKKDSVPLILEKEGDDRTYDNDNKKKLIVNSRVRKTTGETESDFKARRQREFIENYNKNVNTTEELPKYTPLNLEENDKRTALEKLRDYINKIFSKSTAEEEKYFKELLKEKNLAVEEFNREVDLEEADLSLKMKPYKNIQELIDKYEKGERQATDLEGNYYGNQGLETQNATILSSEEYNKVVNFRKIYMKENIEKVQEQLTEGSKQLKKAEKQLQEERYKNNRQADIIEKQQQKLNDLNQLLKTDINTYKEVQDALGIIKDPTLKFKIMKYSNSRSPEYVIKKINEYKQKELRNDYQRVIDEILNSTTYISRRTGKEYGNVIYEDTKFFKELKAINKYSQKQASMELVKLQEQRDKGENTEPQLEYDTKKQLLYFKANSEISPDNMNKIIYNLGKITDIAKEKLNEVKKASFIDVISERKQVRELISNTEKATPHMINKATDKGNWKTLLELIGGKKLAEKFDVLPNEMIMASNLKNKQDDLFNKMFSIFSEDKQQQEKQLLKYFKKLEEKVAEVKYKNTLESGNISESFKILETKENFEDLKTMIIRKLENINNPTATKLKDYVESATAKYRKGTQNTYKHQLNNTDYLNILDALSFIEYSGAGDQETEMLEKQLQKTLTKNHNADFLKYEINGWNLLYYNLLKRNKATNNLIKRYYDEKTVQQLDNLTKEQGKEFKELEQILFESVQDWEELNPYFIVEFNRDLGRAENYFPRRSIHEDEVGMFDLLYNSNNDRDKTISAIERRSLNAIPNLAQNPLSLALSHQAQTEFTKNIAPRLRDFINIFNQDLQKEIAEKYGEKTRNALNVFLQSFKEKGFVNQPTAIEKTTSIIINNWARSVTNTPSVFLKQIGSHIFYSYDLTAGEMVQFYKNLFKGAITPKKTFEFMKEISPYIKQRLDDQQYRQFLEAIKKKEKKENKSLAEKTSEFINELEIPFLEFIKWGDIFSVVYGGYARYQTDLENGKTKEEALKNFERLTAETQQSKFTSLQAMRDLKNREVAEGRLSSMFRSQDIQLLNKQLQRQLEYENKDSTKQERTNRILTQNILNPVMQTLIIRSLINALYGRSRDKEKITLDLLTAILLSFFMPSTLVPATVIGLSRIFRTENLFTKKDAPFETLLTMISIGTKLPVENFYKIFFKRETEKQKKKNENKSTGKKALESLFDNY